MANAQPHTPDLQQLHRDVLAFNEEMRQAPRVAARPALVPFALGAVVALATFGLTVLLLKL
jgi:hypothetical protein